VARSWTKLRTESLIGAMTIAVSGALLVGLIGCGTMLEMAYVFVPVITNHAQLLGAQAFRGADLTDADFTSATLKVILKVLFSHVLVGKTWLARSLILYCENLLLEFIESVAMAIEIL